MAVVSGGFDEESAGRIADAVRAVERMLKNVPTQPRRATVSADDWFPWSNAASSQCPSYGVVAVTGTGGTLPANYAAGTQPNSTWRRTYAVNSPFTVEAASYGHLTFAERVIVAYDNSATPVAGEGWGAKPNQWTISKGYPGFTILGIVDSTNKWALCQVDPIKSILGKTANAIAKGSSGSVNIWAGPAGSEAAVSGWSATCYNKFANVSSVKFAVADYIDGIPYLTAAEC